MAMTVEEIQNVRFKKRMGGYDIKEVDEFVDRCAETVEDLTRKLQILADTLLEYRAME